MQRTKPNKAEETAAQKPSPCDVCEFGRGSARCRGCPHSFPRTWGDLGLCALVLAVLFVVFFIVAALCV